MNLAERLRLRGISPELIGVLSDIAPRLDEAGPWMIVGGVAASAHAQPIGTGDIDVVSEDPYRSASTIADDDAITSITEALSAREGYRVAIDPEEGIYADFVSISDVPGLDAIERDALENPDIIDRDGVQIPIIPAAHLLVSKVITGRDRDRMHVKQLVEAGHKDEAIAIAEQHLTDDDLDDVLQSIAEIEATSVAV